MENQAEAISRMAKDAVQAMISQKEESLADVVEERMRKKEKKLVQPEFRNEGNKDQYKHQKAIWENMEDVGKAIKRKDMDKAENLINEGKKLVLKRIKLIKPADREDWGTVKEYVSDDLASDTEDEKALAKAIKSAAAKKEKRKRFRASTSTNRSKASPRSNSTRTSLGPMHYQRNTDNNKPRGNCWSCGKIGHFQWQCFVNQKRDSKFNSSSNTRM